MLCAVFSLCYVQSLVCVTCSLQSRPSSLRSERASLRSVGRERQGSAHDQFLSSKQTGNVHMCIYTYMYTYTNIYTGKDLLHEFMCFDSLIRGQKTLWIWLSPIPKIHEWPNVRIKNAICNAELSQHTRFRMISHRSTSTSSMGSQKLTRRTLSNAQALVDKFS